MTIDQKECALIVVDLQEKLLPYIHESEQVINNCTWLYNLAQKIQIPTIIAEQYPKGLGRTHNSIRDKSPQSAIIEKVHFSAARDLIFNDKLATLDKKQVILCGIEAHVCVLQTALDLKEMDYSVFVVADAVGSRSKDDKQLALLRMQSNKIQIVSKEMVLFELLEQAGTNIFKEISNAFLKE